MTSEPKKGDQVQVYWGYGLGFRAQGVGEIVKVFTKSVQVRLLEPVSCPYTDGIGWPAGFVLKGIPRLGNPQHRPSENCVIGISNPQGIMR